jgi:putative transcriptional regulator
VASPELGGPYSRTALIVVPSGRGRHMGFIINRESRMTMARLFPQHPPSAKVLEPVFFGGPEANGALFAILPRNPGDPSLRLFGELYVTGNAKAIDQIIEQTPNEARYFAGFVGWQAQELAKEIDSGFWLVGEPDEKHVFRKDTAAMWEELVRSLGGRVPPGKGMLQIKIGP